MANAFNITGKLTGLDEVLGTLHGLRTSFSNKILRPAVTKATRLLAKRVKTLAPVAADQYARRQFAKAQGISAGRLKGLVKKSIGQQVTARGGKVIGRVGARRGFKERIGTVSRGKNKGAPIMQDPARILHLIEKGHGGPHPARAHSFMRRAADEGKGEIAVTIRDETAAGIERAAAKRGGT